MAARSAFQRIILRRKSNKNAHGRGSRTRDDRIARTDRNAKERQHYDELAARAPKPDPPSGGRELGGSKRMRRARYFAGDDSFSRAKGARYGLCGPAIPTQKCAPHGTLGRAGTAAWTPTLFSSQVGVKYGIAGKARIQSNCGATHGKEEKRKHTRLRRQDKANLRSHLAALASGCLHISFSTSQRHYRGTLRVAASAAPSAIHLITNDKLWHHRDVHSAVSTLQQVFLRFTTIGVRDILRMLNLLPILPLWQAITETISISRRGGPEAGERTSTLARCPLSGRSRSPFARPAATPIGSAADRQRRAAGKGKEAAGSTREAGARRWWHPSARMVAAGSETQPAGFARGGSSSRRG